MKIFIPDIPDEGLELELQQQVDSEAVISPVTAHLKIEKVGSEVIVKGDLNADIRIECSRCLKEFFSIINILVDVVYHPVEELKGEEKHEVRAEELDMDFYTGDELDIDSLINEQMVLNLPMKPLCNDQCKGICVKCGADLNAGECACEKKKTDPRLEVLKKLLKE